MMGYISHPNVLSSWMLGFLPHHEKLGEVLSNTLWILHLWTSDDVSAAQHHFVACWLLPRRPYLTILCMLLLCLSLFPLIQDASPPVVSMDILNSSTSKLVTSIDSANALSLSTLIRLDECCPLLSVVRTKRMMRTGAILDAVGNTHIIIVFAQATVRMEANTRTEVTFVEGKLYVNKFSWLKINGVNCCYLGKICHFWRVTDCTQWFIYFIRSVFW